MMFRSRLVLCTVLTLLAACVRGRGSSCHDKDTRRSTAKVVKEMPFLGLFDDLREQSVFEGSDIVRVRGKYYVVFDSSYSIGYLDDRFQFRDPNNQLIGGKGQNDSQFEGIAYVPEDDTFLLLHESQEHEGGYKPFVTTARLSKDGKEYERLSKCVVDFELTHENKGFEGMAYVKNSKGAFLLGLCEGNFCEGGRRGRKSGNGRIIILQLDTDDNGCRWVKKDVLDIPKEANFIDYSAMAIDYNLGRIAILSQENSAFWVADFDIESLDFVGTGSIVHLPRNEHCEIVYCNAEGIQWIDAYRVIVVSDRAKATQPYHCDEHDQSVHIFGLPGAASKASPAIDWE
ncbi:hypothetical protein ACKKBF_B12200 [Auxenochlorella protothecoides x Auxenochlorella symbiontica]